MFKNTSLLRVQYESETNINLLGENGTAVKLFTSSKTKRKEFENNTE